MLDKIKEAERNTGGNSGQGQQQGQGSGQGQQGENAGQSVTPGKDLQPTDPHGAVGGGAGLGSRKNAQGSQSGGGVSKLKAKRTGDKRRWQDVWTDRLPKTRQKIDRITGKLGDSGEMQQLPTKTEAKGGTATTPYYNVYESYKKGRRRRCGQRHRAARLQAASEKLLREFEAINRENRTFSGRGQRRRRPSHDHNYGDDRDGNRRKSGH